MTPAPIRPPAAAPVPAPRRAPAAASARAWGRWAGAVPGAAFPAVGRGPHRRGPHRRGAVAALPLAAALAAALLLAACGREEPPPSPEVVAAVDGDPVRYAEFQDYVEKALGEPGSSLGSDVLSVLFDQFLEERLLFRLAADRGLVPDEAGEGRAARRRAVDRLLAAALEEEGGPEEAEVAAWYRQHQERYRRPERVRLRQILFEDRAAAEAALADFRAGADFGEVVVRAVEDPEVAASGGTLGELAREDVPPAFAEVIFALEPGEVSEVVEADYGYHLFQVREQLPAETLPLDAVRDEVERALREEAADRRLAALVEEARRRYDVSVWDRNLPFNYRGTYLAESG